MAKIKIRTVKLSFPHPNPQEAQPDHNQLYRVEQITDSLDYYPGQYLRRSDALDLCASKLWKVTIVPAPK